MACSGCSAVRAEIAVAVGRGDIARAGRSVLKGARLAAAKVVRHVAPPVVRRPSLPGNVR